jgi:adenylate cyclase
MAEEHVTRKLAAILAADMVGYSRLVGKDEEGTIARQKAHRAELIDPKFAAHGGRIVKSTGDGLLVEFASAVDAVRCATEVQHAMMEREAGVPDDRRIAYRVGINVGDIVIDGDDILGDGVNVAARIEGLAEPGGICLSDDAYRHVRDKLDLAVDDMGEQRVKNIERPVRAYRVRLDGPDPGTGTAAASRTPALELPDKPSIAVLPFDNMSADPEQEYFSDGITEDIITALSRLHWLFVIARNSTFTYKGQPVDIKRVGREMGVRYVLEGSVRKAGNRVRVSAQLVEAGTGNHIWAERYDRDLTDIFELQDELTEAISASVDAELAASERQTARTKTGADLSAWELYQRGMWHLYKYGKDDLAEARRLFRAATERSPEFARAHSGLAFAAFIEVIFGYAQDPAATLQQGLRDAGRAVALDDRDDFNHFVLGRVFMMSGDGERAIAALEKSVDLNPSFAAAHGALGMALGWIGRWEEAIPLHSRAIRLSPHDPALWSFYHNRSFAYFSLDEFDQAIGDAKAAIRAKGDEFWPHLALVLACSSLERHDEARAACARARALKPDLSAASLETLLRTVHPPFQEKLLGALRNAGLPAK